MTNLLQETLEIIEENGLSSTDVVWAGNRDGTYVVPWEWFAQVANVEYDSGYGGQEIASDLVVVFNNGAWLERTEYDGSEGWSYQQSPVVSYNPYPFDTVKNGDNWAPLAEMNRPGGKHMLFEEEVPQ